MKWFVAMVVMFQWSHPCGSKATAQGKEHVPAKQQPVVGMRERDFFDEGRKNWGGTGPRPLRTVLWYPAAAGSRVDTTGDPNHFFEPFVVAPSSEISGQFEKYPLVLLSHGAASESFALMWLGYYLAAHGYIVAAVNHHGGTSAEKEILPQGFFLPWERARDLTVLLDTLLSDPAFGPRIDEHRVGAAGYSAGGYAVISVAGGIYSLKAFQDFCNSPRRNASYCDPPPEILASLAKLQELMKTDPVTHESSLHASDSYKDKRIRGVFAIAPALGPAFNEAGLHPITIPVQIVVGSADVVAPPAVDAQWYASLIKGAALVILPGEVGHFAFGSECTPLGKKTLWICRDAESIDRAALHAQVNQLALRFFENVWAAK